MNEEELIIKELFTEKDFIVYNLGLRKQLKKAIKVSFQKGKLEVINKLKKKFKSNITVISKREFLNELEQLQKEIGEEKQNE